jgi:murein DD-endopeptidase MepM/ murein hydrolase activator NlpD
MSTVERDSGSIALLVLAGGGLTMLIALVLVITVADLIISRGQAQLAADAAALAAMETMIAGADDKDAARRLAIANGARMRGCCGDDPARREVEVSVEPGSVLLQLVVPQVRARAAAALEAVAPLQAVASPPAGAPLDGVAPAGLGTAGGRMWPVDGPVSSGFGTRTHPLTGQRRLHAGLDIAAVAGTPIRAAAPGQVVSAGEQSGYGLTVDIRHSDGAMTRYAHQSRLLVSAGQQVAGGQVIGLVGSTGNSTGPHLHFEVRTPAGPIDPRTWLPR